MLHGHSYSTTFSTIGKQILFAVLVLFASCGSESTESPASIPVDETEQMVQRLQALAEQGNPMDLYHWNSKRALVLYEQLNANQGSNQERLDLWFRFCEELLQSGQFSSCIQQLEGYLQQANVDLNNPIEQAHKPVVELLGLAYLRLGEEQNCQAAHSPESCILPLQGGGLHQIPEGSSKALAIFQQLQHDFPTAKNKWLLNLAAMTLDQKVDADGLELPAAKPGDFPRFEEVAMHVGLAQNGLSGGTIVDDFNGDGLLDVFATSYGMTDQVKLFLADGTGAYADATASAGLTGIVSGLNCLQADYNNDGWLDILILRGAWLGKGGNHPNSLLRNDGDGHFTDVTTSAGLFSLHPTQTAAWADYDRDGYLDLFIGNESTPGQTHACELFRNQGDGTFKEIAAAVGLGAISAYTKGVSWGDINNDGWPDLYISDLAGQNLLYKNTQGAFIEIAEQAGVQKPFHSFPCWFWDVNQDGFEDLFVSGYDLNNLKNVAGDFARELEQLPVASEKVKLYLNNGDETFSEQSKDFGLDKAIYTMGSNFGDLDNDGYLDFYLGTGAPDFSSVVPNRMFRNVEGQRFEEVTYSGNFGHIQKGHGIAFADLDRDGDQDIYAVMGGAFEGDDFTNILYENPVSTNHWIVLELEGTTANRSAIGARISAKLDNGQMRYATINSGGSFGASSLQVELGCGQAKAIQELTIHWPSGSKQVFAQINLNQKLKIVEGALEPEPVSYEVVPFQKGHVEDHAH